MKGNKNTFEISRYSGRGIVIQNHQLTAEEAPTQMLTMGLADIMEAKHILVASSGERKAAVQATLKGPIHEGCPASILRAHPNVTFIMDDAVAFLLEKEYK